MSLELIIQEIKVLGHLDPLPPNNNNENMLESSDQNQSFSELSQSKQMPPRKFRIAFGPNNYISKQPGQYYSTTQLCFYEPITFIYDSSIHAHLLQIQIYTQHKYGDNSDLEKVLVSTVDLSDLSILHGDYVQSNLLDFFGNKIGKLILLIQVFKKGLRFMQKVISSEFFEKVKQQYEKQLLQVSAASKNIKNLIANNPITNTLMTINSMNLIFDKQDTEVYGRQCFLSIKYGPSIKTYSKIVRPFSKENVLWNEYHQFMKNDDFKFVFTFFFYDEWNNIICKCMGQIKYIIFDETINQHTITMFDKKNNKIGVLMVKYIEKEVEKVKIQRKIDKKINAQEARIAAALQDYNRVKFQAKYNKAVLSEKLQELELKRLEQLQAKTKPLNPEQLEKQKQHEKFIELVQKQVIKIERELLKREHQNRMYEKKQKFLPSISPPKNQRDVSSAMKSSSYSKSFAQLQRRGKKNGEKDSVYGANIRRKQSFLNSYRYDTQKDIRKLNNSMNVIHQYRENKVKFPKI